MRYIVTGKEMKLLDQNTSSRFHVPSQVLMEQAAMAFVRELLSCHEQISNVLVVCGYGNNGGDGIAIARLLNQTGIRATVYLCNDREETKQNQEDLYQQQKKIYRAYQFPEAEGLAGSDSFDCIVDAVFGTGLSRAVEGALADTICRMNEMKGLKVAVDIASGVSADTGEVFSVAFCADETYTFSFEKIGSAIWPGASYSGDVHVLPIGITPHSFAEHRPVYAAFEKIDLSLLPKRTAYSHKGTYGKLLIIAGSTNMAGAAYFSAKAAYRTGCGLVRIFTAEENRSPILAMLPEAVLVTYGKSFDKNKLLEQIKWADAVVLGPGLGCEGISREILRFAMRNVTVPMVLDADALNMLSDETETLLAPHMDLILTPHLGEMARLTQRTVSSIQTHLLESAQEFALRYDVICVLKDARTVTSVPYGLTYLNFSGNHGMATAGSGDVLSGVIGSLLSQGIAAATAAPLGVYIHGLAGDAVRTRIGAAAMTASDIIDGLSTVSRTIDDVK